MRIIPGSSTVNGRIFFFLTGSPTKKNQEIRLLKKSQQYSINKAGDN